MKICFMRVEPRRPIEIDIELCRRILIFGCCLMFGCVWHLPFGIASKTTSSARMVLEKKTRRHGTIELENFPRFSRIFF